MLEKGAVYVWHPKEFHSPFEGRIIAIDEKESVAWVRPVRISSTDWKRWKQQVGRLPLCLSVSTCEKKSVFF